MKAMKHMESSTMLTLFFVSGIESFRVKGMMLAFLFAVAGCSQPAAPEPCVVGLPCDDGDNTTVNDAFNDNCNCTGIPTACTGIGDMDGDGICSDSDCDDNDQDVRSADLDRDGFCEDQDCDDNAPEVYPGSSCDDGDPDTSNDQMDQNCECRGDHNFGLLIDPRDSQQYRTIRIGTRIWMADNLNYDNGEWWCYDEDPANCEVYGKLYRWEASLMVCPEGWQLPGETEWEQLSNTLGGRDLAGGHLKDTVRWMAPNTGATNRSKFSALPGGCRRFIEGFANEGINGFWWSRDLANESNAYTRRLHADSDDIDSPPNHKRDWMSVRCVQE